MAAPGMGMAAPGMGMAGTGMAMGMEKSETEQRMAAGSKSITPIKADTTAKMPMTAQQAEEDKMQRLESAWDNLVAQWAADGMKPPPKTARQPDDGAPLTVQEQMWAKQRKEWERVKAQTEAEWAREQGDQEVTYSNQWAKKSSDDPRMDMGGKVATKMAPGVAAVRGIPADGETMATHSTIDIRPITIAVNNLNTTINKVLTAIESRLKKNDINSQLKKMTQFISEINDSLPMPASGGGTRRANIKKRKKTLRSRKNL
jgi:hypothetical protein